MRRRLSAGTCRLAWWGTVGLLSGVWLLCDGCATTPEPGLTGTEDAWPAAASEPARARPAPGVPLSLDLGDGVEMPFVWVPALTGWVGKHEVTNKAFRRFRADHDSGGFSGGRTLNGDEQPVVQVSFEDASAFAGWVAQGCAAQIPPGYVVRLPAGGEWQTFAQCGDGRAYPWGPAMPPRYGNYADEAAGRAFGADSWIFIKGYDDGYAATCPVAESGRNEWGLYGVGGNVWEWTTERVNDKYLLRGASWDDFGDGLCCRATYEATPTHKHNLLGLRLVVLPAAGVLDTD